jgi:hypothetical protein
MKYQGKSMYLEPGESPKMLIRGVIRTLEMKQLSQDGLLRLIRPIMDAQQQHVLSEPGTIEFVYAYKFNEPGAVEVAYTCESSTKWAEFRYQPIISGCFLNDRRTGPTMVGR